MPELEVFTRRPEVHLLPGRIPPAVPFYVPPGCFLRVFSYSSYGTTPVDLRLMLMLPDGTVQVQTESHPPNSDRSLAYSDYPLPECFVVGLCASLYGTSVARGRVWVDATVYRGLPGPGAVSLHTLIQGYTSGRDVLKYPEGRWGESTDGRGWIRSITGTDPAAGSEISETVPTGALWRLHTLRMRLTTSAVAGDRQVCLKIDDGANVHAFLAAPATQPASLTYGYNWAPGLVVAGPTAGNLTFPLPRGYILAAGWRFYTNTGGLDAGDDYAAPVFSVEEWIAP